MFFIQLSSCSQIPHCASFYLLPNMGDLEKQLGGLGGAGEQDHTSQGEIHGLKPTGPQAQP